MRFVGRSFSPIMVGILMSLVGSGAHSARADHRPVVTAAHAANSGEQGISGRPQKNGTIAGSPKANSSISGSQIRGKH
jgi:hypothetical protein